MIGESRRGRSHRDDTKVRRYLGNLAQFMNENPQYNENQAIIRYKV